ncbi:MAG: hypothetical protein HKN11_09725 [Rhizobiales bacterium]|nr:hypothetical protein [Hyphomicrobiales bacterium]
MRLQFRNLRHEYYAQFWQNAAHNVGAQLHDWKKGYQQISRDGWTTTVYLTQIMLNIGLSEEILSDKSLTQDLLSRNDYPIPKHVIFTKSSFDRAAAFLAERADPVVVKPAGGTAGGRGITTGIKDNEGLRAATRIAARYSKTLMIEEQVAGASYRLLYLNGEFVDAVRRDSPVLTSDGRHTVRQLIGLENRRRLESRPITSLMPLFVDADCHNKLREQGFSLGSIPDAGRTITIKQAVNANAAAQNHNVRADVHADIIEQGRRLVTDLGLTLGGIDLQCNDITVPLAKNNGRFLELNSPSGLHHHYLLAEPELGTPVAELILEYMFSERVGVMHVPAGTSSVKL